MFFVGLNSRIKKFVRNHSGFAASRFFLAMEEFTNHQNNSDTQIHADLVTLMRDVGTGNLKRLEGSPNYSIYRDWMHSWQKYCTDSNHREAKDCTCELPEDSDEEDNLDNEADSGVDMD